MKWSEMSLNKKEDIGRGHSESVCKAEINNGFFLSV